MNLVACSWIAATTFGWQCPVLVTAMPDEKSRYSAPSAVVTQEPRPDTTCRSVTWNQTSDRCDPIAGSYARGPEQAAGTRSGGGELGCGSERDVEHLVHVVRE